MDVEVLIAGSSKKILVRIPPSPNYSSRIMVGIPSPRQIQLNDGFDKENILDPSEISRLPSSSDVYALSSSSKKNESHSSENLAALTHSGASAVLQSAKTNIPMEVDSHRMYSPSSFTNDAALIPAHISRKGEESQMSKLVAKRILYLADAAVDKLFGPMELLEPEFIPHARQLRQQLISTLISVVKEHLQQKASAPTDTNQTSPIKRQLAQDREFQRTLRPTIETRVR